jgi:hypothetical protein
MSLVVGLAPVLAPAVVLAPVLVGMVALPYGGGAALSVAMGLVVALLTLVVPPQTRLW